MASLPRTHVVNWTSRLIRNIVFQGSKGRLVSRLLSVQSIGRAGLWGGVLAKRLALGFGHINHRVVEYPWVLNQVKRLPQEALIMDIGCAESLLPHELRARGFEVIGFDRRNYPFKGPDMSFVRGDLLQACFKEESVDAFTMVSTIEHVGLRVYDQLTIHDDGDLRAMKELRRILKPGGFVFLTTPYAGEGRLRVKPHERNYNRSRLTQLTTGFQTVKEAYFYPQRTERGALRWVPVAGGEIDSQSFSYPGLACLVLRKPPEGGGGRRSDPN